MQENSFIVPIEKKEGESRLEYLTKSYDCMKEFYKQYAEKLFNKLNVAWCDPSLEILTGEQNFTNGFSANVKWSVNMYDDPRIPYGIWVRSHYDEKFIEGVRKLKELWKSFEYDFGERK